MAFSVKPLGMKQNRLPLQFSIIVPRKPSKGKQLSADAFVQRVDDEKEYLDSLFGGDTSVESVGSYLQTNKDKKGNETQEVVREDGVIVEVSTTKPTFEKHRSKLSKHIKKRKKDWKQQSIFYKIEGEGFIYPYQKNIPTDKSKRSITIA